MGYQFVHLEGFSRKGDAAGRTTSFIFDEAARKPHASAHVSDPKPPITVFGCTVEEARDLHDSAVENALATVRGGKSRKIRQDQHTLQTVVASFPMTMAEIRENPSTRAEAEEWERLTVSWLRSQYGDDLRSVIRHEDETYYHLHAFIVPVSDQQMMASKYHPGVAAKRGIMSKGPSDCEDRKALSKRADEAYRQEMRVWQDSYYQAVGAPCGLARIGPRRRRLTRDQWHKEKMQAGALKETLGRAKSLKAAGEAYIRRTRQEAARVRVEASKEKEAAGKASGAALLEQGRAQMERQNLQEIIEHASRYSGWMGRFRALWDVMRKSAMTERIRTEFKSEMHYWREAARKSKNKILEAEKRAYEAERKASEAEDAKLRATIELEHLRSLVPISASTPAHASQPSLKPRSS